MRRIAQSSPFRPPLSPFRNPHPARATRIIIFLDARGNPSVAPRIVVSTHRGVRIKNTFRKTTLLFAALSAKRFPPPMMVNALCALSLVHIVALSAPRMTLKPICSQCIAHLLPRRHAHLLPRRHNRIIIIFSFCYFSSFPASPSDALELILHSEKSKGISPDSLEKSEKA